MRPTARTILIILFSFLSFSANAQLDIEKYCRGNIQSQIEFAKWGKNLRAQVFENCKSKDYNECVKTYAKKIKNAESADIIKLTDFFEEKQVDQTTKYLMHAAVMAQYTAAVDALYTDDSPEVISTNSYRKCITPK